MNELMINLGSGQRPFKRPWLNVDVQEKWNPDVVADGKDLSEFFKDGCAKMIVSQHCLEHFGCGEADSMIRECWRVLEPGGSLIVTVPDISALCKGWLRGQIDDQLFLTNLYGAYMGDDADRHKWGFTGISLVKTLDQAVEPGEWKHIRTFDNRKIEGADISQDWWILGEEAIK